ncbi:hypothetical protein P20652_0463 [Pseudoalteromonas sp. BSi20652]|nr:hypothetical protein P20652_0463 [Pseudoalteromonas sp. BSi20652]
MKKIIISTFVLIILSGCAYLGNAHYDDLFGPEQAQERIVSHSTLAGADFFTKRKTCTRYPLRRLPWLL